MSEPKRRKPRCTWCGKACDTGYSRHVYGVFTEHRCSQRCARRPVVNTEAQAQIAYMAEYVVAAKLAGIGPVSFGALVQSVARKEP